MFIYRTELPANKAIISAKVRTGNNVFILYDLGVRNKYGTICSPALQQGYYELLVNHSYWKCLDFPEFGMGTTVNAKMELEKRGF